MTSAGLIAAIAMATWGAPRIPYGGEVSVVSWGRAWSIDPAGAATLADLSLGGALFEPLYRRAAGGKLQPVLAEGLPKRNGTKLEIRIRRGIRLHDGRELDATHVAESLKRLVAPRSAAGHVMLPVLGAREHLNGNTIAPLGIHADGHTLTLELIAPYDDFVNHLASPRAAIGVARGSTILGTGPFRVHSSVVPGSPIVLRPHEEHWLGRPYIERLEFVSAPTTFAARAKIRRNKASLVFGLSDISSTKSVQRIRPTGRVSAPSELIVLAVGRRTPALRNEKVFVAMDAAINRTRLTRRYLAGDARPATTLFGDDQREARASIRRPRQLQVKLLIASDRAPGLRFAERLQLDLHRAGVSAVIKQVSGSQLDAHRARGDFDLLLDRVLLEPAHVDDGAERLYQLASVAAWCGDPTGAYSADDLVGFAVANEPGRQSRVEGSERAFRLAQGLIPIATRLQAVWGRTELRGITFGPDGVVAVDQAYYPAPRTGPPRGGQ